MRLKKNFDSSADKCVPKQSITVVQTAFSCKKLNFTHTTFKNFISFLKKNKIHLHYKHELVKLIYENNP